MSGTLEVVTAGPVAIGVGGLAATRLIENVPLASPSRNSPAIVSAFNSPSKTLVVASPTNSK